MGTSSAFLKDISNEKVLIHFPFHITSVILMALISPVTGFPTWSLVYTFLPGAPLPKAKISCPQILVSMLSQIPIPGPAWLPSLACAAGPAPPIYNLNLDLDCPIQLI